MTDTTKPCILVWRFWDAPIAYRELSPHGGDEDWVAFVPQTLVGNYIGWLEPGGSFGRCDVSVHDVEGGEVHIGAHA